MFERGIPPALFQAALQRLRDEAVPAGAVVAWLGLNRWEMLALLAACEAQGVALLPLNWRLAAPELQHILQHAGASVLWHDETLAEVASRLRVALPQQPHRASGVEPGDLLLVYTSGTTAEPKGVLHTAAGMRANAAAAIEAQGFDEQTRVLSVLPLFHVGGLCIQTLPVLQAGGSLRLHARFDVELWFDELAQWQPSTCLLVPALMRALTEHPRWAAADLSCLRFVTVGSQIVPLPLIEAFHARGIPVAQVYGATETGPVSLVIRPEEALAQTGRSGRAAQGVQVRLAADGEIMLRAANLMRGYHRQAAPAFDAEGWFATGDLAVQHEPGWFEVVGRSKDLIVSGGENIHPVEIEELVATLPFVAECAVVGLPDERWGEVPVLALVLRPQAVWDEAALRGLLQARLARFKHPREWRVLPSLPKTALGKVQRVHLAQQLAREPKPTAASRLGPAQAPA